MSTQAWIVLACHIPLLAWLVLDHFNTANRWADWFEDHVLPKWARWSTQGDWIGWFQHRGIALVASLYVGLWSLVCPESFQFGAIVGGWIAFGAYVVRESMTAYDKWGTPNAWTDPRPNRVGWAVDGLCDVVGPLVVALFWTAL